MALLEIRNLSVAFPTRTGAAAQVVENLDLDVDAGDVVGIVGESGSGKSVTMLAVMGLLPKYATVHADRLTFDGIDLLRLPAKSRRKIMGKEMAMIFQEPVTRLNPCFSAGSQIVEMLKAHEPGDRRSRKAKAIGLLDAVGIPDAEKRMSAFPHQLSGGMSQRVMIAMAIACRPRLLIADEPSTALDVTIQAQILELLASLQREQNMALVLITHDMAVVASMARRVIVMYAGQVMEVQPARRLFDSPSHPYTSALLSALPDGSSDEPRLPTIPGTVPGIYDRPKGCVFQPRCAIARSECIPRRPRLEIEGEVSVRCFFPIAAREAVS